MKLSKSEIIDELNEKLDSLSPKRATEIFSKLTLIDLLDLNLAVQRLMIDVAKEAATS